MTGKAAVQHRSLQCCNIETKKPGISCAEGNEIRAYIFILLLDIH